MCIESAPLPSNAGLQAEILIERDHAIVLPVAGRVGGDCTSRALVDHDAIAALWSDDVGSLFLRVVSMFVMETEMRCRTLEAASLVLDRAVLRHEGHTLKGGAANVGAARLEDAAAALELAASIASPSHVVQAVAYLCEVACLTTAALGIFVPQEGS